MRSNELIVVDKHIFFSNGLYKALEVLEYDPYHIMSLIKNRLPDVVLLDINYPSNSGLKLCKQIVRSFPSTSVVILTPNPTIEELVEVMQSGAAAYLSKSTTAEEMVKTIKQIFLGQYPINDTFKVISPAIKQDSVQSGGIVSKGSAGQSRCNHLTRKELEILEYVAIGAKNKQIADNLHLSEQTIKNHVSNILAKLIARDRSHAAVLAMQNGWIEYKEDLLGILQ